MTVIYTAMPLSRGETMRIVKKIIIKELSFPLDGVYKYDAQLWTSLDGGKTFYHCGVGKYCKTLEEAEEYKQQEEAKQ